MAYKRKTYDEFHVQCMYNGFDGFETVYVGETRQDARERLKEYRKEDWHALEVRLKTVRVPIEQKTNSIS